MTLKTSCDKKLVEKLLKWLGYDGTSFFEMCMEEYGTYTPVWNIELNTGGSYPHPVHLREGMAVRNFLLTNGEGRFFGMNLDDVYVGYITEAIKLCKDKRKLYNGYFKS